MIISAMLVTSCGGSSKETPESVAEEWCSLLQKVADATSDEERDQAREAMDAFEDEMQEKYGDDEAFMEKVEPIAEACEERIEGGY